MGVSSPNSIAPKNFCGKTPKPNKFRELYLGIYLIFSHFNSMYGRFFPLADRSVPISTHNLMNLFELELKKLLREQSNTFSIDLVVEV